MFERSKITLLLSVLFFGAVMPLVTGLSSYYYDILISVGISIILAVGLNLVNGHTGQFSLGQAGFMAVGAYLGSAMSMAKKFPYFDLPTWDGAAWLYIFKALYLVFALVMNAFFDAHNLLVSVGTQLPGWGPFLFALLYGGLIAALAGLVVGIPSLRLKGDYLAIVTLGFNEIIRVVIQNAEPLGAQRGLGGMVQYTNFFWTFAFAALAVYVVGNLVNSTYGRGFLAVRDDEIAAEAMGINTTKYKVLAFVIAAFFAGIAGGLYAHYKQYITSDGFNFMKSFDIVVMVILGGMGNTVGVCIAAVILTLLPEVLREIASRHFLPEWLQGIAENRMILYALLLILLMLWRPQGLFGGWKGRRKQTV